MPKVSILIPAYNVEKYLSRCLDSVLAQTFQDIQVVVVDDGSKDGTWSVMQEFASRDDRIDIYSQENHGVAETRNRLLSRIKGEFFLFIDADDWIESDMVEYLITLATRESSEIVMCGIVKNDENPSCDLPHVSELSKEDAIRDFLRHKYFNGSLCNKLIKRSLLHDEKFIRGISYGEDALFVWELLQRVSKVLVSDKQMYHYRMNENSLSHARWTPEKKGSGHTVWKIISDQCQVKWPKFSDLARTRFAIEDMWGLYYASLSEYPSNEHIKERQLNIRKNMCLVLSSDLITLNKKVACLVLAYCYGLGRLLKYTR